MQDPQKTYSQTNGTRMAIRIVPLLAIIALIVIIAGLASSRGTFRAHADSGWNQIWSDDFNGAAGTGLSTADWHYDTGTGFGTGEIENMTSSTANVQQDGSGHLNITALRDANGNWTSGRIETQRADFAAPAGGELQVSASLQQPNVSGAAAAGYWPAFWMLGAQYRVDQKWPNDGEIDTMENINGLSSVFGTLHCGVSPGGPCNEGVGIGSGKQACSGCQTGFHTYTVIIDRSVSPEQIHWYLDGNNYFSINANQVPAATWSAAVDHGFYVIFDLAIGGDFPAAYGGGPTSATQSGASMIVDNVQVSTANGPTSNSPTISGPTAGNPATPVAGNPATPATGNPATPVAGNPATPTTGWPTTNGFYHPGGWSDTGGDPAPIPTSTITAGNGYPQRGDRWQHRR